MRVVVVGDLHCFASPPFISPVILLPMKAFVHLVSQVTSLDGLNSSLVQSERPFQSTNATWRCHAEEHS